MRADTDARVWVSAFLVATGQLQRAMAAELPHGLGFARDRSVALVAGAVVADLLLIASHDACEPPDLPREQECCWVLGLRPYQVWAEGYRASGDRADATFLGTARASSFRGAVDIIRDKSETPDLYTFKGDRCFLWGCELFDNEADARRRFG